jgi:hypothetical protein
MRQVILNLDGLILFELNYGTFRNCVEKAVKQVGLQRADFRRCNLSGYDLEGGEFQHADFQDAALSYVNFRDANLSGANFNGAVTQDMDIRGARIDSSCWSLWRGNQGIIMDEEQAKQFLVYAFNAAEKYWPGGLTDEQRYWLDSFYRISDGLYPAFE